MKKMMMLMMIMMILKIIMENMGFNHGLTSTRTPMSFHFPLPPFEGASILWHYRVFDALKLRSAQPIHQSTHRPINQATSISTYESIHPSIYPSIHQLWQFSLKQVKPNLLPGCKLNSPIPWKLIARCHFGKPIRKVDGVTPLSRLMAPCAI